MSTGSFQGKNPTNSLIIAACEPWQKGDDLLSFLDEKLAYFRLNFEHFFPYLATFFDNSAFPYNILGSFGDLSSKFSMISKMGVSYGTVPGTDSSPGDW